MQKIFVLNFVFSSIIFMSCLNAKSKKTITNHKNNAVVAKNLKQSPLVVNNCNFSKTYMIYSPPANKISEKFEEIIWEQKNTNIFDELIVSWNALRPSQEAGSMVIFVRILHNGSWTPWHRLALWKKNTQQTFINKKHRYVHTLHCRVSMQRQVLATGFAVRVLLKDTKNSVKALFACASRTKKFKVIYPDTLLYNSCHIKGIQKQSQMTLDHPRASDLCSPTSISLIVDYFYKKRYGVPPKGDLHDFVVSTAHKVHDQGYLNIYGNWILNVAEASNICPGVLFQVERLNSFDELYKLLLQDIPVAVSVRSLQGGATPYAHGHIMVIVGWDAKRQAVLCIDPAFHAKKDITRAYPIKSFLDAWGRSMNLSYVPQWDIHLLQN